MYFSTTKIKNSTKRNFRKSRVFYPILRMRIDVEERDRLFEWEWYSC
ncbi:hypothetical protein LEP1GSC043_0199 [Leptospira weilii str. Ecochallenge]|uniref:Uncharacterized protein n=1 Tax=Leptospira weilii str. Ecochallenge TaxID=1049986 RepID=N1U2T3_9LEPT|nr:hypothetical protein LEP1GSC043_0199 [Leptospira weilii str. Ecochallenge]